MHQQQQHRENNEYLSLESQVVNDDIDDNSSSADDGDNNDNISRVLVLPLEGDPDAFHHRIETRYVAFDSLRYISDAWRLLCRGTNPCVFGLFCVSYTFLFLLWLIISAFTWMWLTNTEFDLFYEYRTSSNVSHHSMLLYVLYPFLRGWIQVIILWYPLIASFYTAVFNAMRTDGLVKYVDFFAGYKPYFWCHLAAMGTLLYVANQVLLLFFILPGLYFGLGAMFSIPIYQQQYTHVSMLNSIGYSFTIVNRYFCSMCGFVLSLMLLQVFGALAVGVGIIITLVLAGISCCFCYHHLIGANGCALQPSLAAISMADATEP